MNKRRVVIIIICLLLVAGATTTWFFTRGNKYKFTSTAIPPAQASRLWYKGSIIYTLDVEVFQDSDGDGVGDFKGLKSRLGYIDSLGVDVIWLAPFQPTPNGDDGYDVADFYSIDKRLGTMEDYLQFMQQAKQDSIRVIMDLVANHTSNQHPWFQSARLGPQSPYYSWYVWSKERPENYDVGMVFPGPQKAIWSYDSVAGQYYYHRFYNFQPDLNTQNPAVPAEIKKIVKFWMDRGMSGFRLDAVPFYIEKPQKEGEEFEHEYEMLYDMHTYIRSLKPDAIILGEANVLPDENKNFFGEQGEGMQMMFNFFVNQHLFYALATADVQPLKDALARTAEIPPISQWGQFLRNHDEIDLGRLGEKDRQKVYDKFGPEENMQLYDRGIRRRLGPMLGNNRRYIELANSLLLSLQSTPVIRYGDEIGMGDDLRLHERLSVRTPMQWSAGANGGFTSGLRPVRPVVADAVFGYTRINAASQLSDSNSLLNWTKKMIGYRKQHPEIAYGSWKIANVAAEHVLALVYEWNGRKLLTLHNFSPGDVTVSLGENDTEASRLVDVFTTQTINSGGAPVTITLPGFGYKWYQIKD